MVSGKHTPRDRALDVPACSECNAKLGKIEEELFILLGMCVDVRKVAASGVPQKVLRALGIGVKLSKKEEAHRAKKRERVLAGIAPYSGKREKYVLPGFGATPGYDPKTLKQILIPADLLLKFQGKLIRGLEYKFGNERYVGDDFKIATYNVRENSSADVDSLINRGSKVTRGPGFSVARLESPEREVLYRITIWDSLTIHGSIMKKRGILKRISLWIASRRSGKKLLEELAKA